MGYSTKFSGAINLSRPLTLAEAKEILDIVDADGDDLRGPRAADGAHQRTQWVPTESLDAIVWDGGEKFYDSTECMQWLCKWLLARGISASGEIIWSGPEAHDHGTLTVIANIAEAHPNATKTSRSGKPLTLDKLGEMALSQLTAA